MKLIETNMPQEFAVKVIYDRDPRGRIQRTHAVILKGEKLISVGVAESSPSEHSPSRAVGRAVAIGRAMKRMGLRNA